MLRIRRRQQRWYLPGAPKTRELTYQGALSSFFVLQNRGSHFPLTQWVPAGLIKKILWCSVISRIMFHLPVRCKRKVNSQNVIENTTQH